MHKPPCTVCARADRAEIDERLTAKLSIRRISAEFGAGRTALANHASHTGARAARARSAAARGVSKRRRAAVALEPVEVASPADVLSEWRWLYDQGRTLLAEATQLRDWRLAAKAVESVGGILDKFSRAFGLYADDAAKIVVNTGEQKIINVVSSMSEEDLRRYLLTGERVAIDA